MIESVTIHNFKSMKELSFRCKRVNILIGKPNAGKSNILESIGLFGLWDFVNLKELVRFNNITDFFHEFDVKEPIIISIDDMMLTMQFPRTVRFKSKEHASEFTVLHDGNLSKAGSKEP